MQDYVAHVARKLDRVADQASARWLERTRLVQVAHELANEERAPRRLALDGVREALALLVELLAGDLAQEQRHLVLVQAGEIETGDALLAGDIGEEGLEIMRLPSSVARYVPTPTMSVNIIITVPIWALSRAIP